MTTSALVLFRAPSFLVESQLPTWRGHTEQLWDYMERGKSPSISSLSSILAQSHAHEWIHCEHSKPAQLSVEYDQFILANNKRNWGIIQLSLSWNPALLYLLTHKIMRDNKNVCYFKSLNVWKDYYATILNWISAKYLG